MDIRGDIIVVRVADLLQFEDLLKYDRPSIIGGDLSRLIDESGCRKILLNFERVNFMTSEILGKLMMLHRKMMAIHGKIVFCCLDKKIRDVFELSKLVQFLTIVDDEESGLKSF